MNRDCRNERRSYVLADEVPSKKAMIFLLEDPDNRAYRPNTRETGPIEYRITTEGRPQQRSLNSDSTIWVETASSIKWFIQQESWFLKCTKGSTMSHVSPAKALDMMWKDHCICYYSCIVNAEPIKYRIENHELQLYNHGRWRTSVRPFNEMFSDREGQWEASNYDIDNV